MNDLEKAIVSFMNEMHRNHVYSYERYQLLHGAGYEQEMDVNRIHLLRNQYKNNSYEAAYELKTYYAENQILSNTIVLKMRPKSPEIQAFRPIQIYSETHGGTRIYTHHVIEIFKEDGQYKVLDVLHRNHAMVLDQYLDEVCRVNDCPRSQLRYDMGYLAPSHAFAHNMKEFSDLMRYLDKTYQIGKPRQFLLNVKEESEESLFLSDDIAMDFDTFGTPFGLGHEEVMKAWSRVCDCMMGIRVNLLHLLCLGHIMRDPIQQACMSAVVFDDEKVCVLMEKMV